MIFKNYFLKINFSIILITVLIIGLFLIFYSFFQNLIFSDTSQAFQKGAKIELKSKRTLIQKFKASQNNLAQVEILMGGNSLKKGDQIKILLLGSQCQNKIAQKIIQGPYPINSHYSQKISWKPLTDSKNKIYCLKIKLLAKKKKIRFYQANSQVNYFIGGYKIIDKNGKLKKEDKTPIVLRLGYKEDSIRGGLNKLILRISQYKPWFLKNYYLKIILFIVVLLSILEIVILIVR